MAVTFNRSALIKAANAALTNHTKAQVARTRAVEDYKLNHRGEWSPEKLTKLRDWLTQQLRRNAAPTRFDARKAIRVNHLEDAFYGAPDSYQINRNVTVPKGLLSPAQVQETRALLEVLKAASGDVVSANELKLLGLTKLSHVFKAAAGEVAIES